MDMQVYRIYNKITNKSYIGITKWTFNKRYSYGKWWLYTHNTHLKKSVQKYGLENFDKEILWDGECSIEELIELEEIYIRQYNSYIPNGFNLTKGGASLEPSFIKHYELVDCFGNFYQVNNLSAFCEENSLNYGAMLNMVSGRHPVSQGFALSDYDPELIPNPNKLIIFENIKTGEIREVFNKNSSKFAIEKNLNKTAVRNLILKKINIHRNWKLIDTELPSKTISLTEEFDDIKLLEIETGMVISYKDIKYNLDKEKRRGFYRLFRKQRLSNFGYRLAEISDEEYKNLVSQKLGKKIKLIDLFGNIIEIKNLSDFCRKNDFCYGSFLKLINKRLKTYKGWKNYEEE